MDDREWERLVDYLAGTLPPDAEAEFRRWIEADPDRLRELKLLERIWSASSEGSWGAYDSRAAWQRLLKQIGQVHPAPARVHPRAPRWRFAGPLPRAAAVLAVIVTSALAWEPIARLLQPETVALREITAATGQRVHVRLSDGSRVVLAPQSRLRYPAERTGNRRDVYLRGAALFQVTPDPDRPFLVHAGATVTRVLGTTFVVRAYPSESIEVAVAEGRVALRPDTAAARRARGDLVLTTGKVGRVAVDGSPSVAEASDLAPYFGWAEGRLAFLNAPLPGVLEELERWYGVDLRIADAALARRHLTISFAEQPLEQVLELIVLALDARYERSGGTIVLFAE